MCVSHDVDLSHFLSTQEFVELYNKKHLNTPEFESLNPHGMCARNDGQVVVPAEKPVCKAFKNGDDIWLVSLEEGFKENNAAVSAESEMPAPFTIMELCQLQALA